jgi:uncharacterized integral membrane protein
MWHLIFALFIAILISAFATLNNASVSVNFIFWLAPAVPLALMILLSVLLGVILATLFEMPEYFKIWQKMRELEKKLKKYEDTIIINEEKKR